MVLARDVENARLIQIIKELQRHRFGRRAETLPEDQLLLGLEEAEQLEAAGDEEQAQTALGERQGACRQAPGEPRRVATPSAAHGDGRRHRGPCLPVLPQ
ncbi:transposase [Mesorhizobium sp. LjNodule214]